MEVAGGLFSVLASWILAIAAGWAVPLLLPSARHISLVMPDASGIHAVPLCSSLFLLKG
jgi:hypothetical protein